MEKDDVQSPKAVKLMFFTGFWAYLLESLADTAVLPVGGELQLCAAWGEFFFLVLFDKAALYCQTLLLSGGVGRATPLLSLDSTSVLLCPHCGTLPPPTLHKFSAQAAACQRAWKVQWDPCHQL